MYIELDGVATLVAEPPSCNTATRQIQLIQQNGDHCGYKLAMRKLLKKYLPCLTMVINIQLKPNLKLKPKFLP